MEEASFMERGGVEIVIKSKEVGYSHKHAQFSVLAKLEINKDYNKEAFIKATVK